jgi:hypothetical protein
VQEVSEGVQFEMVSKCRIVVSVANTFWLSSPMLLCMSYFPMILSALVPPPCYRPRCSLMNDREVHVIVLHFLCSTLHSAQSDLIWRIHQNAALCYLLLFLCNWGVQFNLIYLADFFFEGSNALHVTVHFARPRVILVVAQPSNHRGLHSANHGWSHLLLHSATKLCIGVQYVQTLSSCHKSHISHTCETIV